MKVTSVSGTSSVPAPVATESKIDSTAPVILRQVINIANQGEKQAKQQTAQFINNEGGTYANGAFARATTAHFQKNGTWLESSAKLVQENKTIKSKEVGLQIKELKRQEADYLKEFTAEHADTHNLEHIVSQSVMVPKIRANISDKELKVALAVRTAVVNQAPAYLENQEAHANHIGTTRLLPRPVDNSNDPQKFNTIDRTNDLFIDEKGNAFKIIGEGVEFSLQDLIAQRIAKEEYNTISSKLIREEHSPSAAFQYNQLGYAHSEVFRKQRDNHASEAVSKQEDNDASEAVSKQEDNDASEAVSKQEDNDASEAVSKQEDNDAEKDFTASNRAADISYFHMVKEIKQIPYAPADLLEKLENEKTFEINTLDITPTEKIEMVLARLTATSGDYPTAAVAKQTVQEIGLAIPACLGELAEPITPEDHKVPYYTLFQD